MMPVFLYITLKITVFIFIPKILLWSEEGAKTFKISANIYIGTQFLKIVNVFLKANYNT